MRQAKISTYKKSIKEMYIVPPNDLGVPLLTHWYRSVNKFFKTAPFLIVIPLAIAFFTVLAYVSRFILVRLATFIQYGF